jgi:hypothetical protein
MAEDQTKAHWWQTLPAMLSGIAAVIAAITALVIGLAQNNLLPWQHRGTETSTPIPTSPTPTATKPPNIN